MDNTPIVTIKNNAVIANSRDVAAYFGKRHDNVVRDIENLIKQGVLNFEETSYVHEQNGQTYRSFNMTRDGFTLLAMGFTGKKALEFKLRYIERHTTRDALTPKAIGHLQVCGCIAVRNGRASDERPQFLRA